MSYSILRKEKNIIMKTIFIWEEKLYCHENRGFTPQAEFCQFGSPVANSASSWTNLSNSKVSIKIWLTELELTFVVQSSWGAWSRDPERHPWLSWTIQAANQDNSSKRDNINKRGETVSLAHFHLCEHITHWSSGWSRYLYLEARLDSIGIHTTKHYIVKELLTCQDDGSGAT